MKGNIVVSLILLTGIVAAYTPEQQSILDGMNLGFKLGIAYEKAILGQNTTEFNILVDEYNAWIRLHFGEDENLLKSRINEAEILTMPAAEGTYLTKRPFNASSDLSKFGKQEVYAENQPQASESYLSPQEIGDF
jgi:hypothetical protein